MSTWTVVLLAGLASFALRLVPVVLLSRRALLLPVVFACLPALAPAEPAVPNDPLPSKMFSSMVRYRSLYDDEPNSELRLRCENEPLRAIVDDQPAASDDSCASHASAGRLRARRSSLVR